MDVLVIEVTVKLRGPRVRQTLVMKHNEKKTVLMENNNLYTVKLFCGYLQVVV